MVFGGETIIVMHKVSTVSTVAVISWLTTERTFWNVTEFEPANAKE